MPVRMLNVAQQTVTLDAGTVVGLYTAVDENAITNPSVELPDVDQICTLVDTELKVPDHLEDLWKETSAGLSETEQEAVARLLIKYQDVFSKDDFDIGRTKLVKHSIYTGTSAPIKQRPRRAPGMNRSEINKQVKDLLERNLIEPPSSPWASPVVLVAKKDGSKRLCIDYRKLNDLTRKDSYPVSDIEDSLNALAGAKWFSTLDLASALMALAS